MIHNLTLIYVFYDPNKFKTWMVKYTIRVRRISVCLSDVYGRARLRLRRLRVISTFIPLFYTPKFVSRAEWNEI